MAIYSSDGEVYDTPLHHELGVSQADLAPPEDAEGKPVTVAGKRKSFEPPPIKAPDAPPPLVPLPDPGNPPRGQFGPPTIDYPPWTTERPFAMNDNIPPIWGNTIPNIGGLNPPPKPANDNDKRTPYRDSFMSNIKDWIFGPTTPKPYTPEPNQPYPSKEEADFAQQARNAYGTGYEDYVYGNIARVFGEEIPSSINIKGKNVEVSSKFAGFHPISPRTDQEILSRSLTTPARAIESMPPETREKLQYTFGRASLAVSRDPIASLGFSPKDVMIDALVKPDQLTAYGATWSRVGVPGNSEMYTNLGREMSSVVHESIHNGLNKLEEGLYPGDTKTPKEFRKIIDKFKYNSGLNDHDELKNFSEHLARYTMMKVMGDPEKESENLPEGYAGVVEKMKERARALFEDSPNHEAWQTMIKELRDLAAKRIAEKHPMGPR